MPKNQISDLRNHLFETLEGLKDADNPMDLERAKTIADVAQTIINSAKIEVELVKAVGGVSPGSGFFGSLDEKEQRLAAATPLKITAGGGR